MSALARNWWVWVARGALAILFGVLAFFLPGLTLAVLILLFGAYAFVDGAFAIASVITGTARGDRWWAVLLEGILGIIAGVIAFLSPGITAIALVYVIAAWSLLTGILEVAAAIRLRRAMEGEWLLALSGIASIVFGLVVAAFPGSGALAIVWILAAYAVFFGVLMIALGLRIRDFQHTTSNPGTTTAQPA